MKKNLKNEGFIPYLDKEHEDYNKELGYKETIYFNPKDGSIVYAQEFQKRNGKKGMVK